MDERLYGDFEDRLAGDNDDLRGGVLGLRGDSEALRVGVGDLESFLRRASKSGDFDCCLAKDLGRPGERVLDLWRDNRGGPKDGDRDCRFDFGELLVGVKDLLDLPGDLLLDLLDLRCDHEPDRDLDLLGRIKETRRSL